MNKPLKARVIKGRYTGETVRISNISQDEMGRKSAACILANGTRANIRTEELELIQEEPEKEIARPKTTSMPFISGSTSSRTMTHTKNMQRPRLEKKAAVPRDKVTLAVCSKCGQEYNLEERKHMEGKLTECENCAEETVSKAQGKMIFSHKTGATIEIKQDGELKHEADTFDYKNKD